MYARHMDRRDGEPERLLALVNGEDWSQLRPRPAVAVGHAAGTRERASVDEVTPDARPARKLGHMPE
jgi:hypothetical protein